MPPRIESGAEPIPGYKLIERLGGGGFGEVWKATAPGGLLKAIKFVFGDLQGTTEEGQRAEQELKALSRVKSVRHPYILSLERYDIVDGQLLIVMELADRNLYDRLKEARSQGTPGIPREELLRYMEEAAEALDLMLVEYQLQHLDIKPQNIFLVHNHIKIADFGLVKDLAGMMASLTGGVTPVYAAPETFDGWVSRFSDQYSMAIVYQELLTGQRPFASTSIAQLIQQHLQSAPNLTPLPACDREAIGRALSKNPDQRFPSCMELVRALRGARAPAGATQKGTPAAKSAPREPGRTYTPDSLPAFKTDAHKGTETHEKGEQFPSAMLSAPAQGTQWLQVPTADDLAAESISDEEQKAPREIVEGDGVLFPALVIGLGQLGMGALRGLRDRLQQLAGSLDALPHLKLLHVDTDPDAIKHATDSSTGEGLAPHEVLIAKLNRPSHYLKSAEGKTKLATWFNPQMLYRIPRNLVTTGFRALGRLAFIDNYRAIRRRLSTDLEACLEPANLDTAVRQTKLKLRTNRPRVYIIAGLAGGSGSGMFLDMAYVVRSLLKEQGFENPDVVGICAIPAIDRHPSRTLALGNTFAALTELNHYSAPGTTFVGQYDDRGRPLMDADAPFTRTILYPLPEDAESRSLRDLLSPLCDFLSRDFLSPLGRTSDDARAQIAPEQRQPWNLAACSFGLARISFPRRALLHHLGRRLCHLTIKQWASKDATPVRDLVKQGVAEFWKEQELSGEQLISRMLATCEKSLGQSPETYFNGLFEPTKKLDPNHPAAAVPVLQGIWQTLDSVLGKPEETVGSTQSPLQGHLVETSETCILSWKDKLTRFALQLVEEPGYRLAGAEECLRQSAALVEQALQQHETLGKELAGRVKEARDRLDTLLANLQTGNTGGRRSPSLLPTVIELLRVYPRWRLQSITVQRVCSTLVSIRGHLSDQLREINYCRNRLIELIRGFEDVQGASLSSDEPSHGRLLFPGGARTLTDTMDDLQATITGEDLHSLDERMQGAIRQHFRSLLDVCMASANVLKKLSNYLQEQAEDFLAAKLEKANVGELYMAQIDRPEQRLDDLASVFHEAIPELASSKATGSGEICVVAVPPGPIGAELGRSASSAITKVSALVVTGSEDDILIYREKPFTFLADLEQLGPLGYEAYRQIATVEHFTPHSRIDVHQWRSAHPV